MKTSIPIETIISGCKKQQAEYQKALVFRYSELLYAVCYRYLGDRNKAQDVLQESFIKIFKAINNFDPNKGKFEGWIRKITVNESLKYMDRDKLKTITIDDLHKNQLEVSADAIHQLSTDELLEIVSKLPEGYRQVFNLSVIEGYKHREIAEMLGIREVSSRSNLSRAKAILREQLLTIQSQESWVKSM